LVTISGYPRRLFIEGAWMTSVALGRGWFGCLWVSLLMATVVGCQGDSSGPTGDRNAGETCIDSTECASGLCLSVSATRNICTLSCTADGSECPTSDSWTCEQPEELSKLVCVCRATATSEVCGDGLDNNCDGFTDDCQTCNGRVVPLNDRVNCGTCGNVCPIGSTCENGSCECPDGLCPDAGVGPECLEDGDCNDGIVCTEDTCIEQRCIRRVVPARCPSGEVCDLRMGGCIASRPCANNNDCADTDPCTTNEICDPSTKVCLWLPLDGDHDDDPPRVCGGTDCDDDDPFTLLGATERCDGADNNCDGNIDSPLPQDACTSDRACTQGACQCTAGTECGLPSCIDTTSDIQHCGACFNDCPATAACNSGNCTCPNGGIICGFRCVDPMTDRTNCGGCGQYCSVSQSCVSGSCIDTDECASGLDNCHADATCTNTTPNYACTCNDTFGGDGVNCAPDECARNTDNCDVNANCIDTLSGYTCACLTGYMGDGTTCTDRDECAANTDGCDTVPDACENSIGGFTCVCPPGYSGTGIGTSGCLDVNECATGLNNCDANAICTNLTGSFGCTCAVGYSGDGITCLPYATLSDLTLSAGTLSPAFGAQTVSYAVSLSLSVDTISLTPTTTTTAEIRVNGEVVLSGTPSSPIALTMGANTINVTLSGTGYGDQTYVVTVTRGASTYVKASNTGATDYFGTAVAISGDTMVVGATGEDYSYTNQGAAYVFVRVNGVWSQQALLRGSPVYNASDFGRTVAISGDTIAVGAPYDTYSFTSQGTVHIFTRSGTTWTQQASLRASNAATSDYFGTSVAIDGDSVVVGAIGEDSAALGIDGLQTDNTASSSGAAYVFTRNGTVWTQQAYVKASNTGGNDLFGSAVAIAGDTVAISAPGEDSSFGGINGTQGDEGASASGAVYVFLRAGAAWSQQAYVKAATPVASDDFGRSLALVGNLLAVGAPNEDTTASNSGAVFMFTRSGTTWTPRAAVKANTPGASDAFGYAVATTSTALLVGAHYEDGSSRVINGADDNAGFDNGAAYMFSRSGNTWTQAAYLKAPNADTYDYFGYSVAMDATTLVVGAYYEDGGSFGINGVQTSNTASASGAVYVF